MSIEIYTGFVGSGKSYHAVREATFISDAPKKLNKWVIANFPIKPKKVGMSALPIIGRFFTPKFNKPNWIYRDNEELTVDYLVNLSIEKGFYGHESQALLVIDEAGIFFNARDWNVKGEERKAWIKFFSQSRKLGYDIILITQDVRMVDRQIRSMCEYEVVHRKMNNYKFFKFLPFTWFMAIKYWNGMRHVRGSMSTYIYRKNVADRYDTMKLFDINSLMPNTRSGEGVAR
jgi:hypothetical protein